MIENAKIARLWSGFHRLAEVDKDLVVKIAETVTQPEKTCPKRGGGEVQDRDSHKAIKLSCG
ncbi:hypothetical protein FACS189483_03970 [Spirochaetia bacterium]|nr:hypothetical protein FACS189483_03970 [Spirochaetia bacterium]